MSEMSLKILHLYPDLLNLYGDTGNLICLKQRLAWRGIGCDIVTASLGDALPDDVDLIFIGSGNVFDQDVLLKDARSEKAADLKAAVEKGVVVLAIGAGYQMLGKYHKDEAGHIQDLMGVLDIYTEDSSERMIGNYLFTCEDLEGATVVGFENHGEKTYLGEGVLPMGDVLKGAGNNGEDGKEGLRYKNFFGANCYGPMLPKNPKLADLILGLALKNKYGEAELAALDDAYEEEAHRIMEERILADKA